MDALHSHAGHQSSIISNSLWEADWWGVSGVPRGLVCSAPVGRAGAFSPHCRGTLWAHMLDITVSLLMFHTSYSKSRVCSSLSWDVSLNNCTFCSDKMTQSQDSASWESLPHLPTCFINSFPQPQGHRAAKRGCPSGKFMEFSFARMRIVHRSYWRHRENNRNSVYLGSALRKSCR